MVRKILLAALAVVAISMPLSAQFVGCPDTIATTGGGNTFPMGFNPEWRYQQLVPASCLPATPFKITDMAYAASGSSSNPGIYSNFQVRMALTTLTALSNNFAANLGNCPVTVMNRPTFTWAYAASTWVDFGLDCKFGYDGRSNIVIEVRYVGGGTASLGCRSAGTPGAWRAYTRGPGAYTNPTATSVFQDSGVLKVRFTVDRTCVLLPRSPQVSIGTTGGLQVVQASAGAPYQIATALGHATQLSLGSCSICLDPDPLFILSVTGFPLFGGYTGNVAANGSYVGTFQVPNSAGLIGLCLSHASVTINPICCTNTVTTEIVP